MTAYYDIVLGLIPLVLAGISAVLTVSGLGLTVAIPLASLVAIALIGHAMFVRTPVGGATPSNAPAQDGPGFQSAD